MDGIAAGKVKDAQFAAEYLNALPQDGEPADLLGALRQIAEAHGGVRAVARETAWNANQLYRTLSPQGEPDTGIRRMVSSCRTV